LGNFQRLPRNIRAVSDFREKNVVVIDFTDFLWLEGFQGVAVMDEFIRHIWWLPYYFAAIAGEGPGDPMLSR